MLVVRGVWQSMLGVVFAALLSLAAISASAPAWSQTPPPPPKKTASVKELEKKVAEEKSRKAELEQEVKKLAGDVKGLKTDLISTTKKVQSHEKDLQSIEEKLEKLRASKKLVLDELDRSRESLAGLIVALERIRRLPPETLVARPGAPLETAQAATVLGAIMPELDKKAQTLKLRLEDLRTIEQDLEANQEKLETTTKKLKGEKDRMDLLLSEREKVYRKTQTQAEKQEETIASLSKEARTLRELIEKIEEKNRALERKSLKDRIDRAPRHTSDADSPRSSKVDSAAVAATLPSLGRAQLPVSGIVKIRYGEKDDIGADSQGLHIDARAGAVVVSPMGGIVRYAGPFKNYGSIILVEHKNNYHSLIAGLDRIDTVVGQSLDAGEPVGSLASRSDKRPELYYELRFKGQAIDPSRKFTDLGG